MISLQIETNHPIFVANYLNSTLEQMAKNTFFSIKSWQTEQVVMSERESSLITVRDIKTAEVIQLVKAVYHDVTTALSNELAVFCEKIGINFVEVLNATNTNSDCHLPFPGIINSVISTNAYLLADAAENVNTKLLLSALARKINDGLLTHAIRLTRDALRQCGKSIRRSKISVFGISHPPGYGLQRSPTRRLVSMLRKRSVRVSVYDPLFSYKELKDLGYPSERTLTKTVEDADCLLIAVGRDKFKRLNLKRMKHLVKKPAAIVDLSGIIDSERVRTEGFIYRGLGRGISAFGGGHHSTI